MAGTAASRWRFWAVLAVGVAFVASLAWWTGLGSRAAVGTKEEHPLEGLQVFGTVPPFSLIERSGKPVTRDDLTGKVWIVNFFYTHCPDTCPLQSAQMARLQADFAAEKDLRLVSITVDPERDTRRVLSEYANRYGADLARWLFLTGEKAAIYRLAQDGFRLSVVDPEERKTSTVPTFLTQVQRYGMSIPGLLASLHMFEARSWNGTSSRFFEPRSVFAHHGETGKTFLHSSRFVLVDRQARIRGYYHSNDEEALQRLRKDVRPLLRGER